MAHFQGIKVLPSFGNMVDGFDPRHMHKIKEYDPQHFSAVKNDICAYLEKHYLADFKKTAGPSAPFESCTPVEHSQRPILPVGSF